MIIRCYFIACVLMTNNLMSIALLKYAIPIILKNYFNLKIMDLYFYKLKYFIIFDKNKHIRLVLFEINFYHQYVKCKNANYIFIKIYKYRALLLISHIMASYSPQIRSSTEIQFLAAIFSISSL